MQKITLTKATALKLLDNMADEQRDLCWKTVYKFKWLMNFGLFEFRENSPIGFCSQSKVKNGQHRIMAFILSNLETIDFTICF